MDLFNGMFGGRGLPVNEEPPIPPVRNPLDEYLVYYRIGITNDDRVSFMIKNQEIIVNQSGLKDLIKKLSAFIEED
jgi:hypothetical protein